MKKRALLFGADKYVDVPSLPATKFDVQSLGRRLRQLDFDVYSKLDLTRQEMLDELSSFGAAAPCDSINIVYFSGHGGQDNGENYIYTGDFIENLRKGIPFGQAALNIKNIPECFIRNVKLIIILDACRTDFFAGYSGNFSEMVAFPNTYIAYATQFRKESICDSTCSYFTEQLCEHILTPNITLDQLFTEVRATLYNKYSIQIPNSVNGLRENIILNSQPSFQDIDIKIYNFVSRYGDMYTDKYGCFAGDDLVFIDAAQCYGVSLLDAIYKHYIVSCQKCHQPEDVSEAEKKLISLWNMLGKHRLTQNKFYTWEYNGRPLRLGEIPPLPASMQCMKPEPGKQLSVEMKATIIDNGLLINTNLPDNFQFFGYWNNNIFMPTVVVKDGRIEIPFPDTSATIHTVYLHSVAANVTGVDMKIVGDKCRNLTGPYVKFEPISGSYVEFQCTF